MKALSRSTQRLLAPAGVNDCDILRVETTADDRFFILTPYTVTEETVLVAGDERVVVHSLSELTRLTELHGGEANVKIEKGEHRSWPSFRSERFLKRFPEGKPVTGASQFRSLQVPVTDISAAIISTWPENQLKFAGDARVVFEYVITRTARLDLVAETIASFKETNTVPETAAQFTHPNKELDLAQYQKVAASCLSGAEGFSLFMEQGTGKTPVVIAHVCKKAREKFEATGQVYRAIVACPKNVRMNWAKEIEKFATIPGKVSVIRGGAVKRFQAFIHALTREGDEQFSVVIVSYEMLARMNELYSLEWDLAVLDESHYIKSSVSQRFKFSKRLRDSAAQRVILTGTPITNTALDLYAQWEFLGDGWSGFSSYANFKKFYGVWKPEENGHNRLVGLQNLPFMQERLARQSFTIRKEEALPNLPKKLYDIYEVEMTPEQTEVYNNLRDKLAHEIEADLNDSSTNKAIVVNNVLTKLLRLAQVTSGFAVYTSGDADDNLREVIRFDPCPKIDASVDIFKQLGPDEKMIIWACWVPDIRDLQARFVKEGIDCVTYFGGTSDVDREEAERRFNWDRSCRLLIGNPAAGGTGLNLLGYPPGHEEIPTNCSQQVYYSQDWSPTKRSQSEDRANRRGTRVPTKITDLVVPGTIDEEIRTRVLMKHKVAFEISDLRQILKSILSGEILND